MGVLNIRNDLQLNTRKFDPNAPFNLKRRRDMPSTSSEQPDGEVEELSPVAENPSSPELTPEIPSLPPSPPSADAPVSRSPRQKPGRVRLGCDISTEFHRRLRIHAIKSGKSVLAVIEGWIEMYCPAE